MAARIAPKRGYGNGPVQQESDQEPAGGASEEQMAPVDGRGLFLSVVLSVNANHQASAAR